jgi:hypothetical protein
MVPDVGVPTCSIRPVIDHLSLRRYCPVSLHPNKIIMPAPTPIKHTSPSLPITLPSSNFPQNHSYLAVHCLRL